MHTGQELTYAGINAMDWGRILAEIGWAWQPPLTVHLPIQPIYSPDFLHVDSALNVCRRRVLPDRSVTEPMSPLRNLEALLVSMALDDPPFVPDYRYTKLKLAEGCWPVVEAEYFSPGRDLLYRFQYYSTPLEDGKSLLWVRGSVTNEGIAPRMAHVRVNVNIQREADVFDYHYVPFSWDASRWLPCERITCAGHQLSCDGCVIGKILPGKMACTWESACSWQPEDYSFGPLYEGFYAQPAMRFSAMQNVLHFQAELAPGAQEDFALALLPDFETPAPEDQRRLLAADPEADRQRAIAHFRNARDAEKAEMICPMHHWEDIFRALQLSSLQLLVQFPGKEALVPTQGGSSERHFVWVWEAVFMLRPLLPLGHFAAVRSALEFIFGLQDGGYPPVGHFTTTAGAIGTTGPRWMNTTGAALALAVDYYRYAHDDAFLAEYLPKMLRAADWIIGEIRATRALDADGARPLTYGLMPFGCATDGDVGYTVAFTDAYTYWGLDNTAQLLAEIGHVRAAEVRNEAAQYRQDIHTAVAGVTRPDGYIERKILTGGSEERVFTHAENTCGASHLAYCGALDIDTEAFRRYLDFMEAQMADGPFLGKMDRDIYYMGVAEHSWQDIYLRLGEWKKAFLAVMTTLQYGMTRDTFQVQERFSKSNPAFTPWQPNAGGNGRILEMLVKSFYFETDGKAVLLGGIPFAWLRWNQQTALRGLYTPTGRLTLEAEMLDSDQCRLHLQGVLPQWLSLPDHFAVCQVTGADYDSADGCYATDAQATEVVFALKEHTDKGCI